MNKLNITLLPLLLALSISASAKHVGKNTREYSAKYDFSNLLKPKHHFLGYIGPKYQRLNIEFTTVSKNNSNPLQYDVEGSTSIKKNTCNFKGTVTLKDIQVFKQMHYGSDDELKDAGIKAQGKFIGIYKLNEEKEKTGCGVFSGKMYALWYVDKEGKLQYDDIENDSDGYANNQYEGTWSAYGIKDSKIANWGEHRIPQSGDLDIGAGEFGPNPKYKKQGWEDLAQ